MSRARVQSHFSIARLPGPLRLRDAVSFRSAVQPSSPVGRREPGSGLLSFAKTRRGDRSESQ